MQIGTKDDEDKPKFAGLHPGQKLTTITFDEAMKLFSLPRELGVSADGDLLISKMGPWGPYVTYGKKSDGKDLNVSIKGENPFDITLEQAAEYVKQKKIDDANRLILDFPDDGIQVLNGRYGPYITNLEKNARIPKDREPSTLTLQECQDFLEKARAAQKEIRQEKSCRKEKSQRRKRRRRKRPRG